MQTEQVDICVAGGGSWGTALAHIAATCGHRTRIFLRDEKVCRSINEKHENSRYLPGCTLHPHIEATTSPEALGADILIFAVPCQQQRNFVKEHANQIKAKIVLNAAKGIELATLQTGSTYLPELFTNAPEYAVLSGPSFAKEVMQGLPTAVVIAAKNPDIAAFLQQALSFSFFRCYTSSDVIGVEVGGAIKNVIAIASGLCDGLGIGHNGGAALITRGLAEISRIGTKLGANPLTFMGLSGLGDLVLTATGDLSRNRQLGLALGHGLSLKEAGEKIGMVTEGVKTSFAVKNLSKRMGTSIPITLAVCDILEGKLSPKDAAHSLMGRALKEEQPLN